jgi:hypothetical protein
MPPNQIGNEKLERECTLESKYALGPTETFLLLCAMFRSSSSVAQLWRYSQIKFGRLMRNARTPPA